MGIAKLVPCLILAGCGAPGLVTDLPPGSSVVRCTDYSVNAVGPFTGTSVQGDGCQCLQTGDDLKGRIVYKGDKCDLTIDGSGWEAL